MKRSCFMLIELLIAIAMIAILLAILNLVMHSVRLRTRALVCSSHIRSLTIGMIMYEYKNESYPYGFAHNFTRPPGGYAGNADLDSVGWWWFQSIDGFIEKSNKKTMVFNCPSKLQNNLGLKHNTLCGNYGVNLSICKNLNGVPAQKEFAGTPLSNEDIPNPSQTLLIVDCGYSIISWWHATDFPPTTFGSTIEDTAYVPGLKINKTRNLRPGQELDANYGRHLNKTDNVGFVDGHVTRMKAEYFFVEKTSDEYKNKSPLWSPK